MKNNKLQCKLHIPINQCNDTNKFFLLSKALLPNTSNSVWIVPREMQPISNGSELKELEINKSAFQMNPRLIFSIDEKANAL